jgi:hypothetical protein
LLLIRSGAISLDSLIKTRKKRAPLIMKVTSKKDERCATVKIIGVATLMLVLASQGILDFRSDTEAFPTVSMPSFEGAPDTTGHRTVEKLTIVARYADGTAREADAETLFEQFHYSSARFSIDHLLKNDPILDAGTIGWLRRQVARVGDGAEPTSVTFTWQDFDLDITSARGNPVGQPTITTVGL